MTQRKSSNDWKKKLSFIKVDLNNKYKYNSLQIVRLTIKGNVKRGIEAMANWPQNNDVFCNTFVLQNILNKYYGDEQITN